MTDIERRPTIDEAKVVALRDYGLTHKQIAARLKTSLTTVGNILAKHARGGRQAEKTL